MIQNAWEIAPTRISSPVAAAGHATPFCLIALKHRPRPILRFNRAPAVDSPRQGLCLLTSVYACSAGSSRTPCWGVPWHKSCSMTQAKGSGPAPSRWPWFARPERGQPFRCKEKGSTIMANELTGRTVAFLAHPTGWNRSNSPNPGKAVVAGGLPRPLSIHLARSRASSTWTKGILSP